MTKPGTATTKRAQTKVNPNSWCQEIRKLLGHQEIRESARKSPGKYLNSAGNLAYLRLRCSGEPQEEKKITNFFPFSFFFWKSQGKISFLIYLRQNFVLFPGIYQEIT